MSTYFILYTILSLLLISFILVEKKKNYLQLFDLWVTIIYVFVELYDTPHAYGTYLKFSLGCVDGSMRNNYKVDNHVF